MKFTLNELEAIENVISAMNDKDAQRKIYYKIEKKLKNMIEEANSKETRER